MAEFIALDVSINLDEWDSAVARMLDDAARIEELLTFTLSIEADTAAVDELIGDVESVGDEAVEFDVDFGEIPFDDIESGLAEIDATIEVEAETDTSAVEEEFEAIPDEEVEIRGAIADIQEKMGQVDEKLRDIRNLAIVDFIFNIPENFTTFVDTLKNLPGVSFLIDTDDALAQIEARTGQTIEGLDGVINRIYGETGLPKSQIADVLTSIIQQGETSIPVIEDMGQRIFGFAEAFDKGPLQVLTTIDSMIRAGLITDYAEGLDLMTIAIQSNADKGQDLLGTMESQAALLKELGFTGEETVSLIASAVSAGLPSAQSAVQLIRGLIRTEGNTAAEEAIDALGLTDEQAAKDAGEITGGQYVEAILEAIRAEQTPEKRREFVTAIFGERAKLLGVENILGLTTESDALVGPFEGAAERAANTIDETMSSAFQRAATSLEVAIITALDNALNISGFLQKLEDAANTFATKLQEGATIAESLEIALALEPGTIGRIESAINNLLIGLLEAVASLGDLLGKDTTGLRKEVARVGAGQFEFDLGLARTQEEVQSAIQTAIDRGVKAADMQKAFSEVISQADLGRAQMIVTAADSMFNPELLDTLIRRYGDLEAAQLAAKKALQPTISLFGATSPYEQFINEFGATPEAALKSIGITEIIGGRLGELDTATLQNQIDQAAADLNQAFDDAIAAQDVDEAQRLGKLLGLGKGEVSEFLATSIQPTVEELYNQLNLAISEGRPEDVQAIGTMLGLDPVTLDQLVFSAQDRLGALRTQVDNTAANVDRNTEVMSSALSLLQKNTAMDAINMANSYAVVRDAIIDLGAKASETFTTIMNLSDAATTARDTIASIGSSGGGDSGGGGGGADITEAQHGGQFPPGFTVTGEQGPELAYHGNPLSVLDADSTSSLFAALRSAGVAGGGGGKNVNITINNTFNNASLAQGVSSAQHVANQVRGFS